MNNYTKHTQTDTLYVPYQDMVEQKEGNEIDFYLDSAEKLRWSNWPGTSTFVGDIEMGEVVAPPHLDSTLKMSENLRWTQHAVPMRKHQCDEPFQDVWDIQPITRADKAIHFANPQSC